MLGLDSTFVNLCTGLMCRSRFIHCARGVHPCQPVCGKSILCSFAISRIDKIISAPFESNPNAKCTSVSLCFKRHLEKHLPFKIKCLIHGRVTGPAASHQDGLLMEKTRWGHRARAAAMHRVEACRALARPACAPPGNKVSWSQPRLPCSGLHSRVADRDHRDGPQRRQHGLWPSGEVCQPCHRGEYQIQGRTGDPRLQPARHLLNAGPPSSCRSQSWDTVRTGLELGRTVCA